MVTTRAADRSSMSPHKQLQSHRPAAAGMQPDFARSSQTHQGCSAVHQPDSESASTSPRELGAAAAAAETTSSPVSQPEVMLPGSRRRALADLQSHAGTIQPLDGTAGSRKQSQDSHWERLEGRSTSSTPASGSLPGIRKRGKGACPDLRASISLVSPRHQTHESHHKSTAL